MCTRWFQKATIFIAPVHHAERSWCLQTRPVCKEWVRQSGCPEIVPMLLRAEILPVHKAGMREKASQREEGKGGGNVLWQKTEDDDFWHSRYAKGMRTMDSPWRSVGQITAPMNRKTNSPTLMISFTFTVQRGGAAELISGWRDYRKNYRFCWQLKNENA